MSDSKQQPSRAVESSSSEERTNRTEYVERSDVGVSLTVKLTRGTGTRDQDKLTAKVKAKTLEDMETLREYIHDLAEDARQIQPGDDE
ncbi:DUF7389 domain-containing protein [Halomarina pelagica]|uniref:DUF7389 domain-containing protein n=1 Tax=Halomarina pelagica TaxID=2961599 RepID=UPI0020C39BD1|nr:hypothetical protein [Halomarina sp. BND7]